MTALAVRRKRVLAVAKSDHRFQFGQPPGGRKHVPEGEACGENAVQIVAHIWGYPNVTLDAVWEAAGKPDLAHQGGTYTKQITLALRTLGLPYEGVYDPDPGDLARILKRRGPIVFLCQYRFWPQWEGYSIGGEVADGVPNGYARPRGEAGRNDLRFTGGHYGVGLSSLYRRQLHRSDVWVRDPDHDSAARPETPEWDVINDGQWRQLVQSGRNLQSGQSYAAIPKRSL